MSQMNWDLVKEEAVQYLSKLIQIDTSNPPGNEMDAILYVKDIAEQNGLYTTIQETAPNRANIIISMKKEWDDPIVLLSHIDVVPANENDWEIHPFSGEIIDDVIWGRGAIDAKQIVISHLMVLILLKRNDIKLNREIIVVITADEENGSRFGIEKLIEERPTIFNGVIAFNEGGGFPIQLGKHYYYLVEMGQKGSAHIEITIYGKKVKNPYMPNNSALQITSEVIEKFSDHSLNEPIPLITQKLFQTIINKDVINEDSVECLITDAPNSYKSMFKAMTQTTFAVTKWNGGRHYEYTSKIEIDCRTLPHVDKNILHSYLKTILAGYDVDINILSFNPGFETTINEEILAIFEEELKRNLNYVSIVPFITIGSNDARYLAKTAQSVFGYCPMLPDMTFDKVIKMVHGVDECLPLESLVFGIKNIYHIMKRI